MENKISKINNYLAKQKEELKENLPVKLDLDEMIHYLDVVFAMSIGEIASILSTDKNSPLIKIRAINSATSLGRLFEQRKKKEAIGKMVREMPKELKLGEDVEVKDNKDEHN